MPIWNFLVSVFVIVQRIFHRPAKESVIDETTPLLEDGGPETEREIERLRTPAPAIIIRSGVPVKPLEIRVNPIFDLSHNATVETFFYSVEPYCVVCRKEFYKDNVNDPEGMWDNCLIAICPAYTGQSKGYFAVELNVTQEVEEAVPPIGFKQNPPMLANVHITKHLPKSKKKDKGIRVPDSNLRQDAYAVHRTCRSLSASVFKDQHINELISQFGQSTKYLVRTFCFEDTWKGSLRSLTPYLASLDQKDGLATILHHLSRCPTEIEDEIRDLTGQRLVSNIVNFLRTTVPLIRGMKQDQPQRAQMLFNDSLKHLTAHTTTIYESTYIDSLALCKEATPVTSSSQSILTQAVHGLQLTLGDFGIGIRALRIIYQDGTLSEWIGSSPTDEFITIIGTKVAGLKFLRDSLKITRIELVAEKSWYIKQRTFEFPIISPLHPREKSYMLPQYDASSFALPFPGWRAEDQKLTQKRNFSNWQVGKHIALLKDAKYIRGITVYCLANSICGIAFYRHREEKDELLGVRSPLACAVHLSLAKGERMVHMLSESDTVKREGYWGKHRCPPFIITTSLSRALVCSQIPESSSQKSPQRPKYLKIHNPESYSFSGLFSDGTTNLNGSIRNLGVTYLAVVPPPPLEPVEEQEEKDLYIPIPQSKGLPENWNGGFMSVATFQKVSKISLRRRGDRVMGLRIKHFDDLPTEILGQYDPSFRGEITTIYRHKKDGDLSNLSDITFYFALKPKIGWGDAPAEYVCNVKVRVANPLPEEEEIESEAESSGKSFSLSGDDLSTYVAWLFTPTSDCIQPWDENSMQKVNVEDVGPKRELLLNPGIPLPERNVDKSFVLWDEHEFEGSDVDGED